MKCVRKSPNQKAYIDEVKIQDNNIYLLQDNNYVLWDSDIYSLTHTIFKNNIVMISYDYEKDIDYYTPGRDKIINFEPNIKINNIMLNGIIIVIKKINNKYYELTTDEIDDVIKFFNELNGIN